MTELIKIILDHSVVYVILNILLAPFPWYIFTFACKNQLLVVLSRNEQFLYLHIPHSNKLFGADVLYSIAWESVIEKWSLYVLKYMYRLRVINIEWQY